jgi:hypothetical protein
MSIQLGNSGRGTDGPAPLMSEEERLKSDVASRGGGETSWEGPASRAGTGSDRREAVERQARRAQAQVSSPEQAEQQRGGGHGFLRRLLERMRWPAEETEQQPGGGHWSESEKPDSPDSRWGGGR